jgi:zinc-binding in reverse transcriptase
LFNGGVFSSDYEVMWKSHIPFKIQIFLWLVRKNKIITWVNLQKKGWKGCITCLFCDKEENADHLFVQCPYVNSIWQWLTQYNNFIFVGMTLEDIWLLDAVIPFKNMIVVEMIRSVVMWTIWLEKNRIYFQNKGVRSFKIIGMHILSLVTYWYQ